MSTVFLVRAHIINDLSNTEERYLSVVTGDKSIFFSNTHAARFFLEDIHTKYKICTIISKRIFILGYNKNKLYLSINPRDTLFISKEAMIPTKHGYDVLMPSLPREVTNILSFSSCYKLSLIKYNAPPITSPPITSPPITSPPIASLPITSPSRNFKIWIIIPIILLTLIFVMLVVLFIYGRRVGN